MEKRNGMLNEGLQASTHKEKRFDAKENLANQTQICPEVVTQQTDARHSTCKREKECDTGGKLPDESLNCHQDEEQQTEASLSGTYVDTGVQAEPNLSEFTEKTASDFQLPTKASLSGTYVETGVQAEPNLSDFPEKTAQDFQLLMNQKEVGSNYSCGYHQDDIRYNGLKKILVIGKTGAGKSTLCNAIIGEPLNSKVFPTSAAAEMQTTAVQFANAFFGVNRGRGVSVIDTVGFDGPNDNEKESRALSDLMIKLQEKCDHINLFVIVVNGQQPRLEGTLETMLHIFEQVFGDKFWQNALIVFTRLPMDDRSKKMRTDHNEQTDEKLAQLYIDQIRKVCPKAPKKLPFLLIDTNRVSSNESEERHYKEGMEALWNMLCKSPSILTKNFITSVDWRGREDVLQLMETKEKLANQDRQQCLFTYWLQKFRLFEFAPIIMCPKKQYYQEKKMRRRRLYLKRVYT
ncbi:uncharacterized protein LOC142350531 [Convolutriloba macropyga]|uniref:uncharacterized protein LOC142350531 n=1 Tax=Convolutriloba macropyga TaxID=536237 RepID=UPI003F52169E